MDQPIPVPLIIRLVDLVFGDLQERPQIVEGGGVAHLHKHDARLLSHQALHVCGDQDVVDVARIRRFDLRVVSRVFDLLDRQVQGCALVCKDHDFGCTFGYYEVDARMGLIVESNPM